MLFLFKLVKLKKPNSLKMWSLSLVFQHQAYSEFRTLTEINYKSVCKEKTGAIFVLFAGLYILLGLEEHCFGFLIQQVTSLGKLRSKLKCCLWPLNHPESTY